MSVATATTLTTHVEPRGTKRLRTDDYDDVDSGDEALDEEEQQELLQDALEEVFEAVLPDVLGDSGTDEFTLNEGLFIHVLLTGTVTANECTFTAKPGDEFEVYVKDLADDAGPGYDEDYNVASDCTSILAALGTALARISSEVMDKVKELRDGGDIEDHPFTFEIDDGGNVDKVDFE